MGDMLITSSSAARILEVSEGTVRAMERRGELPATKTATGVRLFESGDVERVAAERATRRTVAA
jgi:excisionase family DNA binding protein